MTDIIDDILSKDVLYDISNMGLMLLNRIYSIWNIKREIYQVFSTNIRELILFKKHLNNSYRSMYLSKDTLNLYHRYIDKKIRKYYIIEKYSKIWVTQIINKKNPVNTTDLELNFIDEKMCINYIDYKEKKRYIFTHKDFKKISETCLMNSYEFDIDPQPIIIKNPYTNKEFTKTELRYFNSKLKDMSVIWHMFTDSDFDIVTLKYKYHSYMVEICIPSYIEKLDDQYIVEYIIDICMNHNIDYCYKCISEKNNIKSIKIKKVLINWIKKLKLGKYFSDKYINDITDIYGKYLCYHNKKISLSDTNEESKEYSVCIELSKPLFCIGYYDKDEEKKIYRQKMREKHIKERFRER
jgi:hypothetical protein